MSELLLLPPGESHEQYVQGRVLTTKTLLAPIYQISPRGFDFDVLEPLPTEDLIRELNLQTRYGTPYFSLHMLPDFAVGMEILLSAQNADFLAGSPNIYGTTIIIDLLPLTQYPGAIPGTLPQFILYREIPSDQVPIAIG